MTHVHLIGIGGSGLSAIALVLLEKGNMVSGSDRNLSPLAQRVQAAGGKVFIGHRPENVSGADLVVRSSAIPDDHLEVQAARTRGIPVLKRGDFLEQLIAGQQCIAVAGTHGKTTTTAMIAWMLAKLGHDPSYIIGGVSANLGTNAHAGAGPYFVIEADEYDRMFLGLHPQFAVVTNVEHDHPDCFTTPQDFYQAFREFINQLVPDGVLLACRDDPGAAHLLAEATKSGHIVHSYGLDFQADKGPPKYYGRNLRLQESGGYLYDCFIGDRYLARVSLQVPGQHNVTNSLAALAMCDLLGLSLEEAAQALGEFQGTGRRFEVRGESGRITVIDDYAHHPTEIRVTLATARARYPGRPVWAVWQPHTYSRTRLLFDSFAAAFGDANHVVVTEVYAAREPVSEKISARELVAGMDHPDAHFVPELGQVTSFLLDRMKPGSVLLVLSAGDADQISSQVLSALAAKGEEEFV